jgi:hypothetical protein
MQQINLELGLAGFQNQFPHFFSVHIRPVCARPTVPIIITDVRLTSTEISAPLSDMLHPHYSITIHLHQLAMHFGERNIFRLF